LKVSGSLVIQDSSVAIGQNTTSAVVLVEERMSVPFGPVDEDLEGRRPGYAGNPS
jgi:hypothetical protein